MPHSTILYLVKKSSYSDIWLLIHCKGLWNDFKVVRIMLIESNWTKWNTKLGNNPSRNLSFTDEDSIKSDSLGQQPKRKFGPNQRGWYGWFEIVQVLINTIWNTREK